MVELTLAPDVQRTRAQVEDAARRIDVHRAGPGTHPEVAGAHAAIEWLLGRTDVGPVAGRRREVEGNLAAEANDASMGVEGILPVDPQYARGVDGILWWAMDVCPLPGWVRVTP
jgi:hypothetical protein